MHIFRSLALGTIASFLFPSVLLSAPSKRPHQSGPSNPTFQPVTRPVYLDVTVLNSQGQPVVSGLTRKDFHLTEDGRPQQISSFQAPSHPIGADSNAPATIIVLDLLNSGFGDFSYMRVAVRKFLMSQPALLPAPVELFVLGNNSLKMPQGYTRDRNKLLQALNLLSVAVPYKKMSARFDWQRFYESVDALDQIGLQNMGVPGHKILLWVGHGGPGIQLDVPQLSGPARNLLRGYAHKTINMMVNSRITLYVIYPDLNLNGPDMSLSAQLASVKLSAKDPFGDNIDFGIFTEATGGKLFYNRNDIAHLMTRAAAMGSEDYTLAFQPSANLDGGGFQHIQVTLDNHSDRPITRAGYYAPSPKTLVNPQASMISNLNEAASATVPFTALHTSIKSLVRHPASSTLDMVVQLRDRDMSWRAGPNGKSQARIMIGAFSLDGMGKIVASHLISSTLSTVFPSPAVRNAAVTSMPITVRFPGAAQKLQIVAEDEDGGRLGTTSLTRKAVEAAGTGPAPAAR